MFSEKLLHYYVASLKLLRAVVIKLMRSYSICGKINNIKRFFYCCLKLMVKKAFIFSILFPSLVVVSP